MLNTSLGEELLSAVGAYVWLQEILPCSFPKWLQQFTCPTTGTGIFSLFYSSHSGRCVVVSQWESNLHIPDDPGVMALPYANWPFGKILLWSWKLSSLLLRCQNFKCWCEFFQVVQFKDAVNRTSPINSTVTESTKKAYMYVNGSSPRGPVIQSL